MADRFTPNLPSADFDRTIAFYAALGLSPAYRGQGWLILRNGDLQLEFFAEPVDPFTSSHGACLRVDDLDAWHMRCQGLGLSTDERSIPRLGSPRVEATGLRIFYLVDPDGSLIRCVENTSPR